VELLVVIAIIGILIALLLPAVQAAREAARRMQCTNNLKQIGLACQNYHDTYKCFPSAYIRGTRNSGAANNNECWGWQVLIMPFIEAGNMYERLQPDQYSLEATCAKANPNIPNPVPVLQTLIDSYVCPSDSNDGIAHQNRHFGGGNGTNAGGLGQWRPGLSTYVANRGVKDMPQNWPSDCYGTMFYDSEITMAKVSDGTSNTLLAGERDTLYCRSGTWIGIRNPNGHHGRGLWYNIAHARTMINSPTNVYNWGHNKGCGESYSSMHPGGVNMVFCDGSVHFIPETIDYVPNGVGDKKVWHNFTPGDPDYAWYGTFNKLARRNDGFPLGLEF
jgi:prepilin-type processing-associated H-X9-DG protein